MKSKQTLQEEMPRLSHIEEHTDFINPWKCKSSDEDIKRLYMFHERIGEGFCGVVYRASPYSSPKTSYAVKVLEKKKMNKLAWDYLQREMELLRDVECSYIVQLFEVYEDEQKIYMLTELCEGGDLVGLVEQVRGLDEEVAKKFFWQAATAAHYLHHAGIVHRDLKLDNFLLTNPSPHNADLKLIDFGFATFYREKRLYSTIGTPYYVAPEVLAKNYSVECDVWSLGVVLYMMVFATPPFKGKNNAQIFEQIRTKEINFSNDRSRRASQGLKDLLSGLLCKNPQKRMTISEALQSKWFHSAIREFTSVWKPHLTSQLLKDLKNTPNRTNFQKEVSRLIIKLFMNRPEVTILTHVFVLMDFQNTGLLGVTCLCEAFSDLNVPLTETEADQLITKTSLRDHKFMTYLDFIVATISKSYFTEDEYLMKAFNKITGESTNVISFSNIRQCFERFGYVLEDEAINSFMAEFGIKPNGAITYAQFKNAMKKGL